MTKELNFKEQMQWELYKLYLVHVGEPIHECYRLSKLATDQFINNLAVDAREELECAGWKEDNFQAMVESYQGRWYTNRHGDCYNAVERALSGKPLNHQ